MNGAHHYLLRQTRLGPLVPARLWVCRYEPGCPENLLDRPPYWRADIAGNEVDPEELFDRLWSHEDFRPAHPPTHWRYAEPISEERYRFEFERLRWAEKNAPKDPTLAPRRRVAPQAVPLPKFDRENAL